MQSTYKDENVYRYAVMGGKERERVREGEREKESERDDSVKKSIYHSLKKYSQSANLKC